MGPHRRALRAERREILIKNASQERLPTHSFLFKTSYLFLSSGGVLEGEKRYYEDGNG